MNGAANCDPEEKEPSLPTVSFTITADRVAQLRAIAAARGVTLSRVAREAFALALDQWGDVPGQAAAAPAQPARAHGPVRWPRERRRHAAMHGVRAVAQDGVPGSRLPAGLRQQRGDDEADRAGGGDSDGPRRIA